MGGAWNPLAMEYETKYRQQQLMLEAEQARLLRQGGRPAWPRLDRWIATLLAVGLSGLTWSSR